MPPVPHLSSRGTASYAPSRSVCCGRSALKDDAWVGGRIRTTLRPSVCETGNHTSKDLRVAAKARSAYIGAPRAWVGTCQVATACPAARAAYRADSDFAARAAA